jgi:phosphotriesterase-related protein
MSYTDLGITDAHNHVWIDPVPGANPSAPVLNQADEIKHELIDYRLSGGTTILDCQPGECGRNGNRLRKLSHESKVNIIASTGFHRARYYAPDHWLWSATAEQLSEYFRAELADGLKEIASTSPPVRAGFIKIALEESWKETPQAALEGAAMAAASTESLIEIHTEKGNLAEKACIFFSDRGVPAHQLVLCHMDKRPDLGLHAELAHFGVLLEYDTFFRPKYSPFQNLWPLITNMVQSGCADRIALATDMAESAMYHSIGKGPGLRSFPQDIRKQLTKNGIPEPMIQQMLGENIARRLAGLI